MKFIKIRQSKQNMNNSLMKIKSKYILKDIFNFMQSRKLLEIIHYNKQLQRRFDKAIKDYKKIVIEIELKPFIYGFGLSPKFINSKSSMRYFHIYFNNNKEEINRNYITSKDKVTKIKIVIDHGIKSFYKLFNKIKIIEKVDFILFDRNDIKNMAYMFSDCSSLREIIFHDFNTEKVLDMSFMFHDCESLSKLNLSKFKTNNVTNMSNMFSGCSSLTELDLSNFNTLKVNNMYDMFCGCFILKKLNILNFENINNINLNNIFYSCYSLKNLKCKDKTFKDELDKYKSKKK